MDAQKQQSRALWSYDETVALISIWEEDYIQDSLKNVAKNRYIYNVISEKLKEKGYDRTSDQCRIKLQNLKADYRVAKGEGPNKRGKTSRYFDRLEHLIDNSNPQSPLCLVQSPESSCDPPNIKIESIASCSKRIGYTSGEVQAVNLYPLCPSNSSSNKVSSSHSEDSLSALEQQKKFETNFESNGISIKRLYQKPSKGKLCKILPKPIKSRPFSNAPTDLRSSSNVFNHYSHSDNSFSLNRLEKLRDKERIQNKKITSNPPYNLESNNIFSYPHLAGGEVPEQDMHAPNPSMLRESNATGIFKMPKDLQGLSFVLQSITDQFLKYQEEAEQRFYEFEHEQMQKEADMEERRREFFKEEMLRYNRDQERKNLRIIQILENMLICQNSRC